MLIGKEDSGSTPMKPRKSKQRNLNRDLTPTSKHGNKKADEADSCEGPEEDVETGNVCITDT